MRKLKEILYEIVSELNLSTLQQKHKNTDGSKILLTKEMLKDDLLKERHAVREKMAHDEPLSGSSMGCGQTPWARGESSPLNPLCSRPQDPWN